MKKLIVSFLTMCLCLNGTKMTCRAMDDYPSDVTKQWEKDVDDDILTEGKWTQEEGFETFFEYWEVLDKFHDSKYDNGAKHNELEKSIKKANKHMREFENMKVKLALMKIYGTDVNLDNNDIIKEVVQKANEAFSEYAEVSRELKIINKKVDSEVNKNILKLDNETQKKLEKKEKKFKGEIYYDLKCPDYRMYNI